MIALHAPAFPPVLYKVPQGRAVPCGDIGLPFFPCSVAALYSCTHTAHCTLHTLSTLTAHCTHCDALSLTLAVALWCMLASPLMLGNDPRTMTKATLNILTAPEILSISQDKLAKQAKKVGACDE